MKIVSNCDSNTTANKPRVFLQSASKGTNRNAARDQSMEMSKDFERDCHGVRVTINQQMADYTVVLNHIEVGFARDNQIQVANKEGDLLSKTKEGGSIAGGIKKACALIVADWAKKWSSAETHRPSTKAVHNGAIRVEQKKVRQSVTLPVNVATQVRAMAKTRRLSATRMLVELIENGIETEKRKQQEFFELAERFREAKDPETAKRLGDELGRMVFGG